MKKYLLITTLILLAAVLIAACEGGQAPTDAPAADTSAQEDETPAAVEEAENAEVVEPEGEAPTMSWPDAPPLTIDPETIYLATLKTEKGDIVIELYADKAPLSVNNLVFLAREGFYDNTTFHRVLDDFMAQAGDPTGTGGGGPGYVFPDEIDLSLSFDRAGLLAMANPGTPDSNGSQFFITFGAVPWLDGNHTIFGEVVEGIEVLDLLTRRDPQQNPDFVGDTLYTVEISEASESGLPTPTPSPTPYAPDANATDHFMSAMPPAERVDYWNSAPSNVIEPGQIYIATFRTDAGDIVVELMPEHAPNNVNNFIALANAGYYDGTHFYQVAEELVAVGGDPLEDGTGSPGYVIDDELVAGVFAEPGWFGATQPGPDSNNGQFFFTIGDANWLADRFTPLGFVIEGIDVLNQFELRDPSTAPETPGTLLQRVDIELADASELPEPTPTPEPVSPTSPAEGERPLSDLDPADRDGFYNTAPALEIDTTQDYVAVLRTDIGDITLDLFEAQVPTTVNNFVLLAENGFYDGTSFHRVIEEFMAQAGDPTATGAGGPGYKFADEFVSELRHDREGILSMANAGPDTNGSQFFVTLVPTPWLDDMHTVFGEIIEGMDILQSIPIRDPASATEPGLTIERIDIETR